MDRVPGALSARLLIDAGLGRRDVVRGLEREIGLSFIEAEAAWSVATTSPRHAPVRAVSLAPR